LPWVMHRIFIGSTHYHQRALLVATSMQQLP
jgi:hypothetical protein